MKPSDFENHFNIFFSASPSPVPLLLLGRSQPQREARPIRAAGGRRDGEGHGVVRISRSKLEVEEGEDSDGPIDSEEDMQRASALDSATFQFMKYPFPGFFLRKRACIFSLFEGE